MGKQTVRYFDKPKIEEKTNLERNGDNFKVHTLKQIKRKPYGRQGVRRIKKKVNRVNKRDLKRKFEINTEIKCKQELPAELLKKYGKGEGVNLKGVKTSIHQKRIANKEEKIHFAVEEAARTEVLLTEDCGFLEVDEGETTTQFTQKQIAGSVDIASAAKHFDLKLQFGPYRGKYTKNGRHLIIGGKMGHVAAFDWITKKLHCEMNVMETVHDVCWFHIETMFAVAQREWVYIYDNQGIELHCVKKLNRVTRMEFLPYHFLLGTCSDQGYLSWLDVSIGNIVGQYNTNLGRLSLLTQNPWNANLCLGHAKGVVSYWSPKSRDPLAKMLCHKAPILGLAVDPSGTYMATSASNRELKIWDVRKLEGPLQEYKLKTAANNLAFSQKKMLGLGMGNVVEIYSPFEDVLGVGTGTGFTSLLVPGAAEANFDSHEADPFQSKSQRREAEVKSLLEKIQPEMITLDPTNILNVDLPTLQDKMEARKNLLYLKPTKIKYQPRKKAKGKGGSVNIAKNKKILQEEAKNEFIKQKKMLRPLIEQFDGREVEERPPHILDRFLPKSTIGNKRFL